MGLNSFKNKDDKSEDDEYKKLMCSVPGCKNRWSVHIDMPRCSFHQWQSPKKPSEKTVKAWYMENENDNL